MNIKIDYDGKYPTLCCGNLVVTIDSEEWVFSNYCLISGGTAYLDEDWSDHVEQGEWTISEWPDGFPEDLKSLVLEKVNEEIPFGCCGGCI